MDTATTHDHALVQAALDAATDEIGDRVTSALHSGQALGHLAVVVDRAFDGSLSIECLLRADVARHLGKDARIGASAQTALAAACKAAPHDELPIVLLVQTEGYLAVGIRRSRGALFTLH